MWSLSSWRKSLSWLVDLAVAAAVSYAVFFTDDLLFPIVLILVLNVVWLQLKLTPRVIALAFPPRRQELAVTLLPARSYLAGRLKWPLIFALAPSCTVLPVLVIIYYVNLGFRSSLIREMRFVLLAGAAGLLLSISGAFNLLAHQCRTKSTGDISCYIIPALWCGIAAPVAAGGTRLQDVVRTLIFKLAPTNTTWGAYRTIENWLLVGVLCSVALCCGLVVWQWKRAVKVYFRFE